MANSTTTLMDDPDWVVVEVSIDATAAPLLAVDVSGLNPVPNALQLKEIWYASHGNGYEIRSGSDTALWVVPEEDAGYVNFEGQLNHYGRLQGPVFGGDVNVAELDTFAAGDMCTLRMRFRKT